MKAIQIISQDLFDKVRSRFTNLEMGDEAGAITIDPAEARFFDFDFVKEGVNLGRVSISLGDLGSLKIYYSQGITEGQDDIAKQVWYDFLKEMRFFAMRRLLRFDTRDIAKTKLDKNDFQHLAATQGPKEDNMNMTESRWNHKSSKKTSRAVRGATEVIVRHHNAVDETYPGSRSQRKNIKAIFIQNKEGERFKYPFIHIAGAMAMGQHIDHGGVPHDPAGKAIMRMSEQIAQLQEFQRQVQHSQLHDDALGITERAVGRLHELKSQVEALGKRHHYEAWVAEFNEQEQPIMADLDPVTMEQYKSKFTQSSFNENLASLFPLIHSIMQETNTVDLEEYTENYEQNEEILGALGGAAIGGLAGGPLGALTGAAAGDSLTDPDADEVEKDKKEDAFSKFENWADAVAENDIPDDQKENLKTELDNLKATGQKLELGNAYQFFNEFGIENDDLEDKFDAAAKEFPDMDPLEVFAAWAMEEGKTDLLDYLGLTPEEQPAEQPPAEQPPAEPAAAPAPEPPVAEGKGMDAMIQEVAKIVKSFYNRDNPNVGPFRGEEGIAIDVEKKISEKFGEKAGVQARMVAEKFMQKLTQEWSMRHKGNKLMGEKGMAEGSGEAIFSKIASSGDDSYDMIYDGLVGKFGEESRAALQDMYDEIAVNSRLHPDDDFEEIQSRMLDRIEQQYGMSEQPDEGNAFGMQARYADKGDKFKVGDQEYIKSEDDAALEAMSRHAKGWEKYGPGMKELAKAGKEGASEKEMDRIRKKHDRYDEEVELIRRLSGLAK